LSLPIAASIVSVTVAPGQAADYCQCVEYVKRQFGLQGAVGNAKDMIYSLPNLGFGRTTPQVGAIVIMQPSFPGADGTYGHVGIVDGIRSANGKTYITVRAANQAGNRFVEANCTDVSLWSPGTAVDGRSDISFWKRNAPPPGVGTMDFHAVNFSASAASTGVNIRSGRSVNASIVGRFAPNQGINFDGWQFGDTVPDLWTNAPDARWYRVAGTNNWVSSAVINGNAPGSRPLP